MAEVFLSGPLADPDLRQAILGVDVQGTPVQVPKDGAGLATLLPPDALARAQAWAVMEGATWEQVTGQRDGAQVPLRVFRPGAAQDEDPRLTRAVAQHVFARWPDADMTVLRRRRTMIAARAQSWLNAQEDEVPTTRRHRAGAGDVAVQSLRHPYESFFSVEEYDLTHRAFDGGRSPVLTRAAFVSGDAVVVLPYDPVRDCVLLVEQFRAGPFARGDRQPWSIETVAGRIDPGETPIEAARREAQEEAGLALVDFIPLGGTYPSPGAITEYLYNFIALCDLPDPTGGLGGLASEGEDIRTHIVPFDEMMALIETGEIQTGPLILIALHLERRRPALRQGRAPGR